MSDPRVTAPEGDRTSEQTTAGVYEADNKATRSTVGVYDAPERRPGGMPLVIILVVVIVLIAVALIWLL